MLPPLPESALTERFLAATGPGGQNVNKVATAVQLRLDVYALGLHPAVFARLRALAGTRMTGDGGLIVMARRFRTREANRADARERIHALLVQAHERVVPRVKTKPSKAARARRVEGKTARGEVKRGRGRVVVD